MKNVTKIAFKLQTQEQSEQVVSVSFCLEQQEQENQEATS